MFPSATPRAQALAQLRRAFAEARLDSAALDARLLLLAALGIAAADLATRPDAPLGEAGAERLTAFAVRRLAREPVARILGTREFWGLPFALSPETLVPRPDSETVVETALALAGAGDGSPRIGGAPPERNPPARADGRDAPLRILDLGTGSGCLLVALLHERPRASGIGVDRSPGALAAARRNAQANGVGARARFVAADWAAPLRGPFDLVVSNPPYIASPVIAGLDPDVREHDPRLALDGGPDGLDAYRAILGDAGRLLARGGHLVLEIGYDQADAVRDLGAAAGLEFRRLAHDLSGHPRCLAFRPAEAGP